MVPLSLFSDNVLLFGCPDETTCEFAWRMAGDHEIVSWKAAENHYARIGTNIMCPPSHRILSRRMDYARYFCT